MTVYENGHLFKGRDFYNFDWVKLIYAAEIFYYINATMCLTIHITKGNDNLISCWLFCYNFVIVFPTRRF